MSSKMAISLDHPRVTHVRRLAPQLSEPTFTTWDDEPRMYAQNQQPWIVLPAEIDPMRTLKGEIVIPRRCLADLQAVLNSGVDFDRLAVAHEVAPGALPSEVLQALHISPSGIRCDMPAVEKLVGTAAPPAPSARRLANALDKTVTALGRSGKALGDSLATIPTVDPIIFGVIGPAGPPATGDLAAWFALTAWHW